MTAALVGVMEESGLVERQGDASEILASGTGPGHFFPGDSACTIAALVGIGAMTITSLTSLAPVRRRSSEINP